MTPKAYAQYLHRDVGLPFDEACRMAGWSPEDDYLDEATVLVRWIVVFCLLVLVSYAA